MPERGPFPGLRLNPDATSQQKATARVLELDFKALRGEGVLLDVSKLVHEWSRQADTLAYLFAKPLGVSRDQYIDGLPQFALQPETYKGRFDIPTLVPTPVPEKGLTARKMFELAGIKPYYDVDGMTKDWEKHPSGFVTPKAPYSTWLHDGTPNLNRKPEDVRSELPADARGGTLLDGLGLYLKDPKILEDHSLDLPGSQVGSGSAPFLYLWYGGPELLHAWVDDPDPGFGSVVGGNEIETGKLAA